MLQKFVVGSLAMMAFLSPQISLALSQAGADCVPSGQNCTANDANPVIQQVLEVDGQPFDPDDPNFGCSDGDTFSITLRVNYTQNSTGGATRYDLATFVGENGADAIGGAACNVDYLSPVSSSEFNGVSGDGPFRDDDGDACGDLRNTDKPTNENLTLSNILCRDSDGNGTVDVSYLVAWQQNDSQACDATAIANGDTSTLLPGTSSKCFYEGDADLGIRVENPPTIQVAKTAAPTTAQVGATITYTVGVVNASDDTDPVTITTLTDSRHGSAGGTLDGVGDCELPQTIGPGDSYVCQFTATYDAADTYDNTVTASGTDNEGEAVSDEDSASVVISEDQPEPDPRIEVLKVALPPELDEPGGTVTYTAAITNTGNVDGLVISALSDSVYGDVTTVGHDGITATNCSLPQTLTFEDPYACEFTVEVVSQPGQVSDIITASWNETEGQNRTTDSNEVTVTIADLPSAIDVTKSPSPENVTAPGGDVTYTLILSNPSAADTITITTLNDDRFGDLNGQEDCSVPQTIAPGGSYTCSFSQSLTLAAGEEHTNTVTASGTDDDGADVESKGGATVTAAPTYTVVAFAPGGNGSVACVPPTVAAGERSTCTAVPAEGYQVSGWTGDCAFASPSATCELENIQRDQESTVSFERVTAPPPTQPPGRPPAKPTPVPLLSGTALFALLAGVLGLGALYARGRR